MISTLPLFTYGTLQVNSVIERVTGKHFASESATLHGFCAYMVQGESFPAIIAEPDSATEGRLYFELEEHHYQLLDAYEGELYWRRKVQVHTRHGTTQAYAYIISPEHHHFLSDQPWRLDRFVERHLDHYLSTF